MTFTAAFKQLNFEFVYLRHWKQNAFYFYCLTQKWKQEQTKKKKQYFSSSEQSLRTNIEPTTKLKLRLTWEKYLSIDISIIRRRLNGNKNDEQMLFPLRLMPFYFAFWPFQKTSTFALFRPLQHNSSFKLFCYFCFKFNDLAPATMN